MKKISVNQIISTTSRQPFTGRSLKFLQDALDEDKAGIIKAFVTSQLGSYSLTVPYVISGCVASDANKDVTAGEIFYGGKYYETTAVDGVTNVAQFILTKTQDATADPLLFTDGINKNVHDVYKYVATDVASGGDFDATDLVSVYSSSAKIATEVPYSGAISTGSTTYVDMTGLTYTTPNDGVTRKFELTLKSNGFLSRSYSGSMPVTITNTGTFAILNDTTANVLDTQVIGQSHVYDIGGGGSVNVGQTVYDSVYASVIVTLTPNTVIKCQYKATGAATLGASESKLIIKELDL